MARVVGEGEGDRTGGVAAQVDDLEDEVADFDGVAVFEQAVGADREVVGVDEIMILVWNSNSNFFQDRYVRHESKMRTRDNQ